ncbi:MAG: hypothetical protein QOG42_1305 [Solirubrobacteraceae bacterium]|nr:hypothetical protein [Solirubrobacteraceae bacterium]
MSITQDPKPTKVDPIAAHRYVRPIVREITPLKPASRTLENERRAAAARWRSPAEAAQLEEVVAAAAAGDRAAVTTIVERFAPRVRNVARAHRLAPADAEDEMQTTWLRLLEHVHRIRDPHSVGAWLESTARHESLRILKASRRERATDSEVVFDAPDAPVEEQPLRVPERCASVLAMALEQLSDRQRELLAMLFAEPSPSYVEISRALDIPVGSIGPTRARSLARLRENRTLGHVVEECLLDAL